MEESSPQIEFINHLKPQQKNETFRQMNRNQTIKNLPNKDMVAPDRKSMGNNLTEFELDDYLS